MTCTLCTSEATHVGRGRFEGDVIAVCGRHSSASDRPSFCTVALSEDEACGRFAVDTWRDAGEAFGACAAHALSDVAAA